MSLVGWMNCQYWFGQMESVRLLSSNDEIWGVISDTNNSNYQWDAKTLLTFSFLNRAQGSYFGDNPIPDDNKNNDGD